MKKDLNNNIMGLQQIVTKIITTITQEQQSSDTNYYKDKNFILLIEKLSSIIIKLSKATTHLHDYNEESEMTQFSAEDLLILKEYLNKHSKLASD